jgi:hypothetical protein
MRQDLTWVGVPTENAKKLRKEELMVSRESMIESLPRAEEARG